MQDCNVCIRNKKTATGENLNLIHEFKNSYLVLGDHQFYPGYSVLVLKAHVRELHELSADLQAALNQELMLAGAAVYNAFKPWKMNYSCYGNQDQHIHWHIFPRYESDPKHKNPPWANSEHFSSRVPENAEREAAIKKIKSQLKT